MAKAKRTESLPAKNGTFKVGDGCHWGFNGDRYPGTVLYVSDSGRQVFVSPDAYRVVDDRGGYVEGDRDCVFEVIDRPKHDCKVYKLRKNGYFTDHAGRGGWALCPGRAFAQNPSF